MTARFTFGTLSTAAFLALAAAPATAGDWGVRFSYHHGPRYRTVYRPAHRVYYPRVVHRGAVSIAYASPRTWCDPLVVCDDAFVAYPPAERVYYSTCAPVSSVYYGSYAPVVTRTYYTAPRRVYHHYRPRTIHVRSGRYDGYRRHSYRGHRMTVHRPAPRVHVRPPAHYSYRHARPSHRGIGLNVYYRGDHGRRAGVRFSYRR